MWAGLRQGGEVGVVSAVAAGAGEWLDRDECKRAVRLGRARCNALDSPFDLDAFFDLLDGEDTARLLANPGPMPHARRSPSARCTSASGRNTRSRWSCSHAATTCCCARTRGTS